jgi:hypothetical protein
MVEHPSYRDSVTRHLFARISALFAGAGLPVLAGAEDMIMPPADMFDTAYHAHAKAAKRVSRQIAVRLCEHIRCVSPASK